MIFILSAQPDLPHAPGPWLDTLIKKLGHALVFGILAVLYLWALRGNHPSSTRLRIISLTLTILFALSDEIHQMFVPGRNGTPVDVLIDSIGATLAMALDHRRAQIQAVAPRSQ